MPAHGRPRAIGTRISGHLRSAAPASFRRLCLQRSEEHTSELQSLRHLVCRLLLEKKYKKPCIKLSRCASLRSCLKAARSSSVIIQSFFFLSRGSQGFLPSSFTEPFSC